MSPGGAAVHPAANVMLEGRDSIDDDADDASLEAHPSLSAIRRLLALTGSKLFGVHRT